MLEDNKIEEDISTEERIKEAAGKLFIQKGYAATRTRDIAEEAGINLSLLNYYFRSKEKLFQLVMAERVEQMFGVLAPVINDETSNLETKMEKLINIYMDMLIDNPDLPLFVLSEVRNNQQHFRSEIPLDEFLECSILIKQLKEQKPDLDPFHFLINIMSLCVFPYITQPIFNSTGLANKKEFQVLMEERKELIPQWANALLNLS